MDFTQTHTTRKLASLSFGAVFMVAGSFFALPTGYGLLVEGDRAMLGPALVSGILAVAGILLCYRYVFPRLGTGRVSTESIACEWNGVTKQKLRKDDIQYVAISPGQRGIHLYARMKSGAQRDISWFYFPDMTKLRRDLEACGYEVHVSEHLKGIVD